MSVPTMKDVARHAGVSTATVSAVINQTSPVSAPLKARVLQAIGQLNYAPSGVARSLRTRSSRLIGLIIADITNPFFTQLVRSIGGAAQAAGYTVLLCETDHDPRQEAEALQLLAAHGVDGVILAPTGPAEMYFEPPLRDYPRPIVMVDRVVPGLALDSVSIDNHRAAFAVTRHILSFGHRRVGIIAGASHLANTAERLEGFRDALATEGLAPDPADIVYADFREDRSHALCRDLLARADRPTALFVSNNQMVIGAMHALRDLGLDCPADVSLAAIDELPGADAFSPGLTVQRQPIAEIAGHAVRLLLARMKSGPASEPERVILPTRLVIRNSCARPLLYERRPADSTAPRSLTRDSTHETIS